jgi:hypothetical protein
MRSQQSSGALLIDIRSDREHEHDGIIPGSDLPLIATHCNHGAP